MSDEDKEMTQLSVRVPKETKEQAKKRLDHGGLSREVRRRLEQVAHGAEVSEKKRLKAELEELRDEREELRQDRQEIDRELSDVTRRIERKETRLDEIRDMEGEYEGALSMIEDEMHEEGMAVFPAHGKIQQAAELGDCAPQDVIDDLQKRNPSLPEEQFTEGNPRRP